jgi:glycosyltransferase involved in cell wall biosynthesis
MTFINTDRIMNEQILSYFAFNGLEIVSLSLLLLFFLIQLYFYFTYYNKPYSYIKKKGTEEPSASPTPFQPKVSIIISSENEVDELARNLPAILEQDYPDFEVIVVNNGSTDESDVLLQGLKQRYPHLYNTFLPYSNDKAFGRRKLALTLGIKAANGDVLIFTEPYSRPLSNHWISSLISRMSDTKDVVLGYSFFKKTNQFFNSVARFDNHYLSMQYLSMALMNKPYTGVYRNVAFKKQLFFNNKGFSSFLNLENGEDVFINQIVNKNNTTVALSEDSFVETTLGSFGLWKQIKKSYSLAKRYYKNAPSGLFGFEVFSRYIFYLLTMGLIVYACINTHWTLLAIAVLLFLLRLITQFSVINKSANYFKSGKFYSILPLLDLLQSIYNFRFKTRHKSYSKNRK